MREQDFGAGVGRRAAQRGGGVAALCGIEVMGADIVDAREDERSAVVLSTTCWFLSTVKPSRRISGVQARSPE